MKVFIFFLILFSYIFSINSFSGGLLSSKYKVPFHLQRKENSNLYLSNNYYTTSSLAQHTVKKNRNILFSSSSSSYPTSPSYLPSSLLKTLPRHKELIQKKLHNNFTYVLLPTKTHPNQFEAYLEVLTGSSHEKETEQGIAHLTEHITFMGAPRRSFVSNLGAKTNAFTDFHQTVFFVSSSSNMEGDVNNKNENMIPYALDALEDVFYCSFDPRRIEQERAAVLSEATMINNMNYRVECEILSSLHRENIISKRFPIGKINLLRSFTKEDLLNFYYRYYNPENSILYLVGDFDPKSVENLITNKFSLLRSRESQSKYYDADTGKKKIMTMRDFNQHFPPTIHRWSLKKSDELLSILPDELKNATSYPFEKNELGHSIKSSDIIKQEDLKNDFKKIVHTYSHDLLQTFSFHFLSKIPIEPINNLKSLKNFLMRKMIILALQIRLSTLQKYKLNINSSNVNSTITSPHSFSSLYNFIDFNSIDWPRDGCNVCSLDFTCDNNQWKSAVAIAIKELYRLGQYGLTKNEINTYKKILKLNYFQSNSLNTNEKIQSDDLDQDRIIDPFSELLTSNQSLEEIMQELMYNKACNHTVMEEDKKLSTINNIIDNVINQEDINSYLKDFFHYLINLKEIKNCSNEEHQKLSLDNPVFPSSLTVCYSTSLQDKIDDEKLTSLVFDTLNEEIPPYNEEEFNIPSSLFNSTDLTLINNHLNREKKNLRRNNLSKNSNNDLENFVHNYQEKSNYNITSFTLENDLKVNLKSNDNNKKIINFRLFFPFGTNIEGEEMILQENDINNKSSNNSTKALIKQGLVSILSKVLQEGCPYNNITREEIELFCLSNMISVEVKSSLESFYIDLQVINDKNYHSYEEYLNSLNNSTQSSFTKKKDDSESLSPVEAAFQIINIILRNLIIDKNILTNSKDMMKNTYYMNSNTLEGLGLNHLLSSLYRNKFQEYSFYEPKEIDKISSDDLLKFFSQYFLPKHMEVSIVGDFKNDKDKINTYILKYLSTLKNNDKVEEKLKEIEKNKASPSVMELNDRNPKHSFNLFKNPFKLLNKNIEYQSSSSSLPNSPLLHFNGFNNPIEVHLNDTEERSIGYLAGPAPSLFGLTPNKRLILDEKLDYNNFGSEILSNDRHLLIKNSTLLNFNNKDLIKNHLILLIIEEIINKKLFVLLREELKLTYDVTFNFNSLVYNPYNYYLIKFFSTSKENVLIGLNSCYSLLNNLKNENFSSNFINLIKGLIYDKLNNNYYYNNNIFWINYLHSNQYNNNLNYDFLRQYPSILINEISHQDIQKVINNLNFNAKDMSTVIGSS